MTHDYSTYMPKTKNIPYLASTTLLHLITFQPSVFCRLTLNNILMAKHLYIQHRIHSVGLFVKIKCPTQNIVTIIT